MTVLVGYLPSPEGEAAFDAAVAEAARRGEPLLVLNSPRSGAPVSSTAADDDAVTGLTGRASAAGVQVEVRRTAHEGDAADEVLRVAEEVQASVLVIGIRRRSPVGKLLMGSSAQRILLDSDRPVLAVKPAR
ncbi:universal stress protein [Modestobacter sp. Leaf380]|uniref:universal stress protein n=1 Tax=Modestobacter sp. Leaf380 TaxID=1736356 RepID=UPI000701211B|nr:universal stress protein [Modestobacter sp. Leaf380]KQS71142.1 universal stress protein UspA [Modestobacter sp. Leaf380]